MLFKEIITVDIENQKQNIQLLTVKAAGTYSYQKL
jgi:hypothetical protein